MSALDPECHRDEIWKIRNSSSDITEEEAERIFLKKTAISLVKKDIILTSDIKEVLFYLLDKK